MIPPWKLTAKHTLAQLDIVLTGAMAIPFFDDVTDWKLVMAGERSGKSFTGGAYAAVQYMHRHFADPEGHQLIWLIGHDYEACWPEFLELSEHMIALGLLDRKTMHIRDEGRDKCSFTLKDGSLTVETVTGGEPRKVGRLAPDGVLGCEVAIWSRELWDRVLGRLAEKSGWLWASGSFEGAWGWLHELWRSWQGANPENGKSYSIKTSSNLHIFPGGDNDPGIVRQRMLNSKTRFAERFEGIPAPPSGAVFAEDWDPARVTEEAVYDPDEPCEVWIDPGYNGAYAILVVQQRGPYIDIVDELYERGKTSDDIISMCKRRDWWKPHTGVIDIAGRAHNAGPSAIETWRAARVWLSSRKVPIVDGIDRVHTFLRAPLGTSGYHYLRINPSCRGLIAELGGGPPPFPDMRPYRYKTDNSGVSQSDLPLDRDNHACKALAYGLVDKYGFVERPRPPKTPAVWTKQAGPSWMNVKRRGPRVNFIIESAKEDDDAGE